MNDCMVSYETNRYSVPYQYVGSYIGVRDLKNGILEFYDGSGQCIARHEKIVGKNRSSYNKKHFENIVSGSHKKVAGTAPKLKPDTTPKVQERSLDVYDKLLCREVI